MATHSSILVRRIPCTVQSMGLQRVKRTKRLSFHFMSAESVMSFNHLILCCLLLLLPSIFLSIRVFSNELALCIRWPRYCSFSISPFNEYSGLISFQFQFSRSVMSDSVTPWTADWLVCSPCCLRLSESSPAPHFKSINSSVLSLPYGPTFTSVHDYWKNYSFD